MTPPTPIEPSEISWKTPGVRGYAAVVLLIVGLYVTVTMLIPTMSAVNAPAEVPEADDFDFASQRASSVGDVERFVATVDGRSPFFVPPAPIVEEPPAVVVEEEDDGTDRPPPTPTRYGGPDITAAMNGRIWLDDTTVRIGEEAKGVRLVHMDNTPWSVRVEWRGAEFDVDIFSRNTNDFLVPDRDGE